MASDKKKSEKDPFMEDVRVRFAPSPTGWMHIGSVWLVMFNYLWARKTGGNFILRIEDTDVKRTVKGGVDAIYEAFDAFGIDVDEGPKAGGSYGPYVQSERLDLYKKHADELVKKGAAYYCFCSEEYLKEMREGQIKNKQQPMYDGSCRDVSIEDAEKLIEKGEKYVIRLKVPRTGYTEYEDVIHGNIRFKNKLIDDQVLIKSDGFPTYHFAVAVDDHLMNISHVLRGVEYVSSAPKVVLLYKAFGWDVPYIVQTPSILDPDGKKKLSKRGGENSAVKYLRKGYLNEALWNFLVLLGWSPSDKDGNQDEIYSKEELLELFDLRRIRRSSARFLPEKLDHFNGYYIRQMSVDKLSVRIFEWIDQFVLHEFMSDRVIGLLDWEKELIEKVKKYQPMWKEDEEKFKNVLELVQERLKYLSEVPELVDFFYTDSLRYGKDEFEGVGKGDQASSLSELWRKLKPVVEKEWKQESWEQTIRDHADEIDWKHGELFMLVRIAVTGRKASPPLFECMELLGVEKCDEFIMNAVKFLRDSNE